MLNINNWTYNLPSDVHTRLCECRNIKSDLPYLVNARWAWMKGKEKYAHYTKEDALVDILELLDTNGQWKLGDLTMEEYNELKSEKSERKAVMKMTSIKIDTYDVSDVEDRFMVDIVTVDDSYEAWIYHKDYSEKQLMYGCPREQQSYEEFINLVEMGDLKGYIDFYQNTYMN